MASNSNIFSIHERKVIQGGSPVLLKWFVPSGNHVVSSTKLPWNKMKTVCCLHDAMFDLHRMLCASKTWQHLYIDLLIRSPWDSFNPLKHRRAKEESALIVFECDGNELKGVKTCCHEPKILDVKASDLGETGEEVIWSPDLRLRRPVPTPQV